MSLFRCALFVTTLMGSVETGAAGQWNAISPFAGGAIIMGRRDLPAPPSRVAD